MSVTSLPTITCAPVSSKTPNVFFYKPACSLQTRSYSLRNANLCTNISASSRIYCNRLTIPKSCEFFIKSSCIDFRLNLGSFISPPSNGSWRFAMGGGFSRSRRHISGDHGSGGLLGFTSSSREDRWQDDMDVAGDYAELEDPVADGVSGGFLPPPPPWQKRTGGSGGGDDNSEDGGGSSGQPLQGGGGLHRSLWSSYMSWLECHPVLTKAVTAALLNMMADVFCQLAVEQRGSLDLQRILGFSCIGLFIVGPSLHIWYGLLPRIISIPGDTGTLIRLAVDQLIFAPLSLVTFFAIVLTLEGRPAQVIPKLEKDLLPTVLAQWKLWIPFQFINFKFIPPALQVASASLLGLVWTVYMSFVSHSGDV